MAASEDDIAISLRRVVRAAVEMGEDITVNLARARTEAELGLDEGTLKDDPDWKARSRQVINAAVEEDEERPSSSPAKKKVTTRPQEKKGAGPAAKKRSTSGDAKPRKKRRMEERVVDSEDEKDVVENTEAPLESASLPNGSKSRPSQPIHDVSEGQDSRGHKHKVNGAANHTRHQVREVEEGAIQRSANEADELRGSKTPQDDDSSDLSSLIDEPPARSKKRQRKAASPKSKKSASKAKPAPAGRDLTPDEETIKALQSQLLKCGVRKLWHRELARYDSARDKIRHLTAMLTEVGMTGRFSADKARQIKEARELAADLEAAKEFEDKWGTEGGSNGRKRRSRTSVKAKVVTDDEDDDDADEEQASDGVSTKKPSIPKGLVDFGFSGDEGSD